MKSKGPVPANQLLVYQLFAFWTSILSTVVRKFLADNGLLFPEQKGCQKSSRGTLDHLCVDKAILCEVHQRRKNLEIVWIGPMTPFLIILLCGC